MKRFYLVTLLLVATIGLTSCSGGQASSDKASVNTRIGAFTVQVGEPIKDSTQAAITETNSGTDTLQTQTFRQQLQMASRRMPQMQSKSKQVRRRIIEGFVGRQLMMQLNNQLVELADSLNIQADTAQVNQRFRKIRSQFPSKKVYRQRLARQGLTEDSLRMMLTQRVRLQALRQRAIENVTQPTSAEVDSARRAYAQQIKLRHILLRVPRGASPEASDSVRQRAQSLIDSLKSGEAEFAALAQRHSDDPGSAQKGGDLGWVSRDSSLVAPFKEAAFNLPEDQNLTSEPVKTQFGYHIIKVTNRRKGKMKSADQTRQKIVNQRGQEAWQQQIEQLRDQIQATVRLNKNVVQTDLSPPPRG